MEMIERVATAMMDSFIDMVEEGSGISFKESGVVMPRYEIWERYAKAAVGAVREFQSKDDKL